MMSLQTSTHSSQMKTLGPAMSLLASFWPLLQKEQRRTSRLQVFRPSPKRNQLAQAIRRQLAVMIRTCDPLAQPGD